LPFELFRDPLIAQKASGMGGGPYPVLIGEKHDLRMVSALRDVVRPAGEDDTHEARRRHYCLSIDQNISENW
jgi:hypothetical protein